MKLLDKYFAAMLVFLLLALQMRAQSVEYSVKALYIEKFARFTDWKNDGGGECFVIDVLGVSPFNGELEKLTQKLKIKNKPVKINYISNYLDIKDCHLLYISASEKNRLPAIIKHIETMEILTIADTPGFCKKGVHVNLYIDDEGAIRYEINPTALKKAGISVEMQLLNYGDVIQ
jgi:hypothetical protein